MAQNTSAIAHEKTYDRELACFVREIDVCADTDIGVLVTYASTGPDMAACIDRFTGLSPGIREIRVGNWVDDTVVPDMCYRSIDGEWRAFQYKRHPRKHSQTR